MTDLWQRIRDRREIDGELRKEIEELFGRKGKSALDAINAGRVKKYLDFCVVEGKTASYIVEEDFCTCGDFLYRGRTCWHLLAVRIAKEAGIISTVDSWYNDLLKEAGDE